MSSTLVPYSNLGQIRQLRAMSWCRLWPFAKLQHGKWPGSHGGSQELRFVNRGWWIFFGMVGMEISKLHFQYQHVSTSTLISTFKIPISDISDWYNRSSSTKIRDLIHCKNRPLGWAQTCHRSPSLQSADRRWPWIQLGTSWNLFSS